MNIESILSEGINILQKNNISNPQLDSPTRIMWETKLKNLALTEARYNDRVVAIFKGIKKKEFHV